DYARWLLNPARASRNGPERIVDEQSTAQEKPLGDGAPGSAVRAFRAIVSQAEVVARLNIDGEDRQIRQRGPVTRLAERYIIAGVRLLGINVHRIIAVPPKFQLGHRQLGVLGADAGRLQVVFF